MTRWASCSLRGHQPRPSWSPPGSRSLCTQVGYDALGVISCTGTNFLARSQAVQAAGGFPQYTLTEARVALAPACWCRRCGMCIWAAVMSVRACLCQ